jgi:hypothetical protein
MLDDPVKREEMIAFFQKALPPETLLDPGRPIYEDSLRKDNNELMKAMEASSRILGKELGKRRIYVLRPFQIQR